MNLLISELEKRKQYLEELLQNIQHQMKDMPCGKLRISNNRGVPRYYYITEPKDTRGTYMRQEKIELAHNLAQKDYIIKLEKEIQSELKDINNYLRKHGSSNLENNYANLNEYRKELVAPLVLPDNEFVKIWENEAYETNPYWVEHKIYPTKKGEFVRTKSEVLLADMYTELGIPYRYEAMVKLQNGGKNLIVTYEAEGIYLNINDIKKMVCEIFEKNIYESEV